MPATTTNTAANSLSRLRSIITIPRNTNTASNAIYTMGLSPSNGGTNSSAQNPHVALIQKAMNNMR